MTSALPFRATTMLIRIWWAGIALATYLLPLQAQRFDITPLFGARGSGSIKLQQEGEPVRAVANLADSVTFGLAAGIRFDEDECDRCAVIEFRWMRQNTKLGFKETEPVPTPLAAAFPRTAVTLDHYLADFTHEWVLEEAPAFRPYIIGTLGAARLSSPIRSKTRFTFGLGAGLKVFPKPHWGFRFQVEYLPMVMHADIQRIACIAGCVVALSGGLMNQFEVNVGPVFRF
jgi:hypothetical protein